MNHATVAAQAIRFRLSIVRRPLFDAETLDINAMAAAAVTAAQPEVDAALRQIATAWLEAGLPWHALARPWTATAARALRGRSDFIDALDVVVAAGLGPAGRSAANSRSRPAAA